MIFLYARLVFLIASGFVFAAGLLLIFLSRKAAAPGRISAFKPAQHPQPENQDKESNLLNKQPDEVVLN